MKKILIIGAYGMLGHKFIEKLSPDFEVLGTCRRKEKNFNIHVPENQLVEGVDVTSPISVEKTIVEFRPDYILNCTGIIKQRVGDVDTKNSIKINALFPHLLAEMGKKFDAKIIQFSTDCVFSGEKGEPYKETDAPDAHDIYGKTKSLGDLFGDYCLTIRTSFIGRELRGHTELLDWFISKQKTEAYGFQKAIWSGFTTVQMAEILKFIFDTQPTLSGLWHIAMPPISKFELLTMINEQMGLDIELVPEAKTVCNRSLDGSSFQLKTGFTPPTWGDMIGKLVLDSQAYNI